jgi:Malectin domain
MVAPTWFSNFVLLVFDFLILYYHFIGPDVRGQYYSSIGQRVFHVLVEGTRVLTNLDVIRDAPGMNTPLVLALPNPVMVRDSTITIDFVEISGHPQIQGIEVIYIGPPIMAPSAPVGVVPVKAPFSTSPLTTPVKGPVPISAPRLSPLTTPVNVPVPAVSAPVKAPIQLPTMGNTAGTALYRINCGSANQVIASPNNVVWDPDRFSTTGKSYNTCGTNTTSIYCTSRYFRTKDPSPFRYELPVTESNKWYTVRLHFAEQVRT